MKKQTRLKDSRTFETFYTLCSETYNELIKILGETSINESFQNEDYLSNAEKAKEHLSIAAKEMDELRRMRDLFGASEPERQNTAKAFYLNISVAKDFVFSIIQNSPYDYGKNRVSKLEKSIKKMESYLVERKHNVIMMPPATFNQSAEAGTITYKGRRHVRFDTALRRLEKKAGKEDGQER